MTDHESQDQAEPGSDSDLGPDPQPGSDPQPASEGDRVRTGVASVDEALASLDGLDQRPVSEHADVFEDAHRRLRQALSGEPEA